MPPVAACTVLQDPHKTQLKTPAAMPAQYANTTKIAGVVDMRRSNKSGKRHRLSTVEGKPPVSVIEPRNAGPVEECQLMQFGKRVGDVFILAVNLANSIHQSLPLNHLAFTWRGSP